MTLAEPIIDRRIGVKAVAEMYGIHEKSVFAWVRAGRIPEPIVRRPRYTRWLLSQVQADIARVQQDQRKEEES